MQSMARMLQLLGLKSHKKFFLCKKARKLGRKGRDHTHTHKKNYKGQTSGKYH